MATLQPKKANNLEIIKHTFRLEIERRAPVSNSFGSAYFINSAEYLRTNSKEEKQSSKALCKVRGNLKNGGFIAWMESINITVMKQAQLYKVVDVVMFLGPWGAVCSLLRESCCCLSLTLFFIGMFSTQSHNPHSSAEAFSILCEVCNDMLAVYIYI